MRGIAVSPDGRSVYGGSNSDDAIARFDRDPGTGALTPQGCVDDDDTGADACAQSADGLDGAIGVAVSPDGDSVYVAAAADDAIARLDRNGAGALTPHGCVDDDDTGAEACGQSAGGLDGAIAVTVSPGGESVYSAANADDAVARFDREPEDSEAPETQVDSGPVGLTSDPTPTFTFSSDEPVSAFECRLYPSGDPPPGFGVCSGPGDSHRPSSVTDDVYVFEVRATDSEGNADATPASATFTVDTQAPSAPTLQETHPASPANDNSPEIEGVAEEGSTVSLYANGTCAGAPIDTAPAFELATTGVTANVADNSQTSFSATATDGAGNVSACSAPIAYVEDSTVPAPPSTPATPPAADTSAPDTTITDGPRPKEKKGSATFSFSASEPGSTFECRLDGADWEACTSPRDVKVKKGKHTFEVRATDAAGNTDPTPATQSWTVKKKKRRRSEGSGGNIRARHGMPGRGLPGGRRGRHLGACLGEGRGRVAGRGGVRNLHRRRQLCIGHRRWRGGRVQRRPGGGRRRSRQRLCRRPRQPSNSEIRRGRELHPRLGKGRRSDGRHRLRGLHRGGELQGGGCRKPRR